MIWIGGINAHQIQMIVYDYHVFVELLTFRNQIIIEK